MVFILIPARNSLTFVNTTAIAYMQKGGGSLKILVHAIAVVFTYVRELRVTRPVGCGGEEIRERSAISYSPEGVTKL